MAGPERVLVDSGFFIALFNARDRHHAAARRLEAWLDAALVVLPWPILYETVNTRLARRRENMARFGAIVRSPGTALLADAPYREEALATVLAQNPATGPLSLVDAVLCHVIEDVNVPISAMLTFNERDFPAICRRNDVALPDAG